MLHNLPDWMQRRSGFRNTYMSDRRVAMKVALVSQDHELYEVCRTTLRQLSIDRRILEAVGSKHGKADLTIWDISPGVSLTERHEAQTRAQDWLVVSKAPLGNVQKVVGAGGFGFLAKPVKQPALA